MSEPTSRIRDPPSSIVIALPELVELIGQFLTQSDLVSTVQVCRSWNEILIPLLWHTFAIHSQSWRKITRQESSEEQTREETKGWVKSIFEKYGHHIRHLETNWKVVLEAASLSGSGCRNITSLVIGDLRYIFRQPSTVLVSLDDFKFPWVSTIGMEAGREYLSHRYFIERFWILVRQNPGLFRLKFLRLKTMNDLSTEYILETLSMLGSLKDLDLEWTSLDVGLLLSVVPQLEHLRAYTLVECTPLQQDYSSLRRLCYKHNVEILVLLDLMKRLPGLEELQVWQFYTRSPSSLSEVVAVGSAMAPFPQLKLLRVEGNYNYGPGDPLIRMLVGLCPGLVQFWKAAAGEDVKKALWDNCYFLDSIGYYKEGAIEAWRERRVEGGCLPSVVISQ